MTYDSWRETTQIISITCACLSLLFLITPEPERNATNALMAEKLVEEVLPSEAELVQRTGESSELVSTGLHDELVAVA